jgi:pimeloyl-ACP methyl ester carboxylesterase
VIAVSYSIATLSSLIVGASLALLALWVYLTIKYTPKIVRIFEEQPVLMPLRISPVAADETVEFLTGDARRLAGGYYRRRRAERNGLVVFCHEFLSDRFSFQPYIDALRDAGYDIFAFDFRNHGGSERETTYKPMQWTTDRELADLAAALAYLRSRPDHDPAGFLLFGISRGGSTALTAAASAPDIWGVITDGAFPTRGTMAAYCHRWTEIYVRSQFLRSLIPRWLYAFLGWLSRRISERRLNCKFLNVEAAVAKLAPRPWLMIHGERDAYIPPEIARRLFDYGDGPKHLWIVPEAKHNKCRDRDPEAYDARLADFLVRYAPRRLLSPRFAGAALDQDAHAELGAEIESPAYARQVASPIPG